MSTRPLLFCPSGSFRLRTFWLCHRFPRTTWFVLAFGNARSAVGGGVKSSSVAFRTMACQRRPRINPAPRRLDVYSRRVGNRIRVKGRRRRAQAVFCRLRSAVLIAVMFLDDSSLTWSVACSVKLGTVHQPFYVTTNHPTSPRAGTGSSTSAAPPVAARPL